MRWQCVYKGYCWCFFPFRPKSVLHVKALAMSVCGGSRERDHIHVSVRHLGPLDWDKGPLRRRPGLHREVVWPLKWDRHKCGCMKRHLVFSTERFDWEKEFHGRSYWLVRHLKKLNVNSLFDMLVEGGSTG